MDLMKRLLSRVFGRHRVPKAGIATTTPRWRFVSRVTQEQIAAAAEKLLARRLHGPERRALEVGFRPQGLLTPEDEYAFRLAPASFLGRGIVAHLFGLALDGYGRDDDRSLELGEVALITWENPGVEDLDLVEIID